MKRSYRIANVDAKTLHPILKAQIDKKARLMTDDASAYTKVGRELAEHGVVNHGAKEYSRGDVTTNTVESSFALLKRGLYGIYHNVIQAHLQRYATKFDFHWNQRKVTDTERAGELLGQIGGKRLMYRNS